MAEKQWRARLQATLSDLPSRLHVSDASVMVLLALIVGLGTGLGAVVLIRSLAFLTDAVQAAEGPLGRVLLMLAPAIGGIAVLIVLRSAGVGRSGLDVADVVSAVSAGRGRLAPGKTLAKSLGALLAIASGGSAGRESPLMHFGAAIGAGLGNASRANERRLVTLAAAGSAAGLAATFGAPLAGIMFALEVILVDVSIEAFGSLVVAAVTAAVVSRSLLGGVVAFAVPPQSLGSLWQLPLYAALGVLASVATIAFTRSLTAADEFFAGWRTPALLKPVLGGLAVGVIGYFAPRALGMGFEPIQEALGGGLGMAVLAGLVVAKIAATSLTLGSLSVGSVMAPLLFVGAMVGSAYGHWASAVFPGLAAAGNGAYAAAAMAAVLAAGVRAPVTAILLIYELGGDATILPAVVLATVVSIVLSHLYERQSIYTGHPKRDGMRVRPRRDSNLLQAILVEDGMTPAANMETVSPAMSQRDLARLFQETGHHGFVVLDENGELFGIVTLGDLERFVEAGQTQATVAAMCTRDVVTAFPDETLDDALRRLASRGVGRLPVVERRNPRHVAGILRRSGIVQAYSRALAQSPEDDEQQERAHLQAAVGAELAEFVLAPADAAAGKRLRELGLPNDCVVISIHRRGRVVIPRGNVPLAAGDRVIILRVKTSVAALRSLLREGTPLQEQE